MSLRASYVPNLTPYREARQDARAAVYLHHVRRVPRGRRIYLHNLPDVAWRGIRAGYHWHLATRSALAAERSRRGGKEHAA